MSAVFFQPPGIKKEYVELGTILENNPKYIYYICEPAKILISLVKIISKELVFFDKKEKLYKIKNTQWKNN